jgi:hypothetical protein
MFERLNKRQVNGRVSLASGEKGSREGIIYDSGARKAFGAMKATCRNDRSLLRLNPRDSLGRHGKGPPMATAPELVGAVFSADALASLGGAYLNPIDHLPSIYLPSL